VSQVVHGLAARRGLGRILAGSWVEQAAGDSPGGLHGLGLVEQLGGQAANDRQIRWAFLGEEGAAS
jgi:hypothetical protein